jgi:cytochrome c oxidase subunit 4
MSEHVVTPVRTYVIIFLLLLVGTGLTVLVASRDFGWANNLFAMTIAVAKAFLVLYFFMELRHSTRMTAITAIAGFFWLVLMISAIMMDYWSRHAVVLPVWGK